jgi:hypothetical protein
MASVFVSYSFSIVRHIVAIYVTTSLWLLVVLVNTYVLSFEVAEKSSFWVMLSGF